jgi:hypothetical protein
MYSFVLIPVWEVIRTGAQEQAYQQTNVILVHVMLEIKSYPPYLVDNKIRRS